MLAFVCMCVCVCACMFTCMCAYEVRQSASRWRRGSQVRPVSRWGSEGVEWAPPFLPHLISSLSPHVSLLNLNQLVATSAPSLVTCIRLTLTQFPMPYTSPSSSSPRHCHSCSLVASGDGGRQAAVKVESWAAGDGGGLTPPPHPLSPLPHPSTLVLSAAWEWR